VLTLEAVTMPVPAGTTTPIAVVHIPHAAATIPETERASFLLGERDLVAELLRMTDWFTNELFDLGDDNATTVMYPVSRLVVDPERFENDAHEVMARIGMGVVYGRTCVGHLLRETIRDGTRARLLETYYRPHHRRLRHAVEEALSIHDACLVIDAHSFPARPLPYESDQNPRRPDICLGQDQFHTPAWLVGLAFAEYTAVGFRVEVDRPFQGAMVPQPHYRRDTRVLALMVEINRGLYLDESSGEKAAGFAEMAAANRSVLTSIIRQVQARLRAA
jgi:N-formylglutamate deformylase